MKTKVIILICLLFILPVLTGCAKMPGTTGKQTSGAGQETQKQDSADAGLKQEETAGSNNQKGQVIISDNQVVTDSKQLLTDLDQEIEELLRDLAEMDDPADSELDF